MRWSGHAPAGTTDADHFISGIDILPTVLDAAGVKHAEPVDGRSFLPVLRVGRQDGRDMVFTQFHQTAARRNYPMRCVQDRRFGYIFNPWSDGERVFRNESQAGRTFAAMQDAENADVARRVDMFLHRVPEEFYDFERDPNALNNLVDDPAYTADLERLRTALEDWMERTGDPALHAFRNRADRRAADDLMSRMITELGGS